VVKPEQATLWFFGLRQAGKLPSENSQVQADSRLTVDLVYGLELDTSYPAAALPIDLDLTV
jgi:hypothetical protein